MTRVSTKRGKPKKKPKHSTLQNKCDALWRKIVKVKGYCEWCGKSLGQMHAHHIIGRTNRTLRWDLRNGVCLDAGCHKMNTGNAHDDPIAFLKWFETTRPEDYEYVCRKKNKLWDKDYDKVLKYLKEAENENTTHQSTVLSFPG